mmetsp:Transcript_35992/g.64816  ORF Transcript_35992/g.64816 Transcript_35992/m.64816 type:complete len:119 (-) Transcript_35992:130-486(-)
MLSDRCMGVLLGPIVIRLEVGTGADGGWGDFFESFFSGGGTGCEGGVGGDRRRHLHELLQHRRADPSLVGPSNNTLAMKTKPVVKNNQKGMKTTETTNKRNIPCHLHRKRCSVDDNKE